MSEKSVVDQIKHYQRDITKCPDNAKRMIRCIERLMVLPVTIAHLQETGVGRSVNELRKCGGEVGAAANALVCKWKSMVQAEEDSEVESEVEEDEPKEPLQVSSPDLGESPRHKNEPSSKNIKNNDAEEYKKSKLNHSTKKNQSSHSENRHKSSDEKTSDKHDHKSHRSRSSRSEQGSESDSKHSSSHRSKSDHDSRSIKKSHSSHRSESECNGDIKTDKLSSKTKTDEIKSSKSSSTESKNKDVKHRSDKDKHRREDSSHRSEKENRRKEERREESSHKSVSSSSSKKYDVRKIDSESSDDEEVYKPRSKKRKKSESEEDRKPEIRIRKKSESEEDKKLHNDKYKGRSKHRDFKRHDSSEESEAKNSCDEDENSRSSSRHSESRIESDNEEEMSNRSSPNNTSENEVESDSRRSSPRGSENEGSHSDKASDSGENDSPEREIYVPTKIKKEKESPPRQSNTYSDRSKSSHSRSSNTLPHSSSKYSSSHNSNSRSKDNKLSSTKKESFENIKIKKEKDENEDLKKRREEKPSDKKSYKSSKSHSDSSSKDSSKTEKKVKIKVEKEDDGSIDCVSGASFADALMGLSEPKKKSVKRKSTTSSPEKPSRTVEKPVDGKSKSLIKSEPRTSSSHSSSSKTGFKEPDLLSKHVKLEPLDVDLKSTLPEISPHYKPLPHYSPPGSPAGKRTKLLSQEEALSTIMSTKNQRTKVYSGNKSGYLKVPSLFDLCIQVLRDNIEALEYTGGVPYDLLKPVLDRATAAQLFQLEHYNPYLVEDTDGLWKFHCNKDFRGKEPDEFESWRELYVRLLDERERKLEALKANITQSMAKNTPVRQTKLAYVDSVVKPPRNIAKKQMKFGTGKAVKHDLVSKAMVGAASSSPAPPAVPVPAPPTSARSSHSNAFPIPNFLKKKKAPLMQKTLQLIKGNRFKR